MEPYGTAAGTASELQKPHGILPSGMAKAPRNRPEPRMEPSDFAESLCDYGRLNQLRLLLFKILKIKKTETIFESVATKGRAAQRGAPSRMLKGAVCLHLLA